MRVKIRIRDGEDPPGTINFSRLASFASNLRGAALKSAQSNLNLPAFRTSLSDGEKRPEFRLVKLSIGSTELTIETSSDRELESKVVSRLSNTLIEFRDTQSWPIDSQQAERRAWGQTFQALLQGQNAAKLEITVENQAPITIDSVFVSALEKEDDFPQLQELEIVGDLHLIDWEQARPHFKIKTPDSDLVFELSQELRATIDSLRWKKVKALTHWEVGTNRARMIDGPVESTEEASVQLRSIVNAPEWMTEQLRRLEQFSMSPKGWDGYEAIGPQRSRVNSCIQLLRDVHRLYNAQLTEKGGLFGLFEDGTVELEWTEGSRFLNAEPIQGGDWQILCEESQSIVFEAGASYPMLLKWIGWLLGNLAPVGV